MAWSWASTSVCTLCSCCPVVAGAHTTDFFPIANGAGFVLHWYMGSGSVPKENWMYNTDLQLINGYKLDGKREYPCIFGRS